MTKKPYIILIINILMVLYLLRTNSFMHNLYAIFAKFCDIYKQYAGISVN